MNPFGPSQESGGFRELRPFEDVDTLKLYAGSDQTDFSVLKGQLLSHGLDDSEIAKAEELYRLLATSTSDQLLYATSEDRLCDACGTMAGISIQVGWDLNEGAKHIQMLCAPCTVMSMEGNRDRARERRHSQGRSN